MKNILTTFGPRVVGVVASWLAGLIYVHTKGAVTIDATQVVAIGTTMLTAYAAGHRLTSSAVNPGDSASTRLADAQKSAVDTGTVVKPNPPGQ